MFLEEGALLSFEFSREFETLVGLNQDFTRSKPLNSLENLRAYLLHNHRNNVINGGFRLLKRAESTATM